MNNEFENLDDDLEEDLDKDLHDFENLNADSNSDQINSALWSLPLMIRSLRNAIRMHRDEKRHDRCWLDDLELYKILPEGIDKVDQQLPSEKEFLENCKRYYDHRQNPNLYFIRQKDLLNLIPLDMSKADKHEHPDIKENTNYLCLIGDSYFAGKFTKQWFGWTFMGWINPVGFQFDAPNFNNSTWKKIWEIKEAT